MSLLDTASLILTPNGYKASKLYSVKPTNGDGDMVVSRNTTATRVNSAGFIELVPINLFSYSQTFDNTSTAGWYNTGLNSTVIPNVLATSAPNGTFTADKLVATAVLGSHLILQTPEGSVSGSTVTASVFAKAAELTRMVLLNNQGGGGECNFILSGAGSYTIVSGVSANIQPYPDGWYRCIITYTPSTTGLFNVHIKLLNNSGVPSFLGNGSDGIYLWGAQLETGTTATEYFPTTDRFNIPRVDYLNSTTGSLLVEPTRTNDALQSDGNLSTYTILNVTDASSSFNSFVNAIQFPSTATAYAYKAIVTTAQTYTISVFIKMDDNSVPILSASSTTGNVSLVISGNIATSNLKVENYGNNVYRLSATATSNGVNVNNGVVRFDTQVLKSFKTTGIQLEAGSNATSYIPTTTLIAGTTRNADVISKTGVSSLIGQTEGTLYAEFNNTLMTYAAQGYLIRIFADANNEVFIRKEAGTSSYTARWRANSVNVYTQNSIPVLNGNNKIAFAYKSADSIVYLNGVPITIPTPTGPLSGAFFVAPSIIGIGSSGTAEVFNDRIKSVTIFKTRLSNPQLGPLTT